MNKMKRVYRIIVIALLVIFGAACVWQAVGEWLQPHDQIVDWTGGPYQTVEDLERAAGLVVTGSPVSARAAKMGGVDGTLVTFAIDGCEKGTKKDGKVLVFSADQQALQEGQHYKLYLQQHLRTGLSGGFARTYRIVGGGKGIVKQ